MRITSFRLVSIVLLGLLIAQPTWAQLGGARNKDGSFVTGVLTAQFDPTAGILPFPNNLLFDGTTDLTLNPPVEDPTDLSDPTVALSGLDGFSTIERWVATFVDDDGNPGSIDPASVIPGQSVRVFEVTTSIPVVVTGIVEELTPGVDYVAVAQEGGVLVIQPLAPLKEYTNYMAVVTNDITDTAGNNATPDQTYFLSKRRDPWVDANGQSTYALIDDATAQGLEGLRQLTLSMELNAAGAGVNPDDIILAWVVQTQSITPTLALLRSVAQPAPTQIAPTGFNTALVGGMGLADISIGVITLPYYGGVPSAENPIAPLTDFWQAEPGAYIPPFDQLGLDPTSTNLTLANPFPVLRDMQTVPLLITVPNENSGFVKPATGWPVLLYMCSLTRNRTDALAFADAMASVGFAVVSIDQPLHGVVPAEEPQLAPFYIENTPFGAIANERTFDVDYFNNETNEPVPDGIPDRSGLSYFNLSNLRTIRDNLRQAQIDTSVLALSLPGMSVDGDATPDLDGFNVAFAATSGGVFANVATLAIEPIISRAYINTGGAQAIRTAEAGAFGVLIRQLLGGAGIEPGSADFEQFLLVAQTVIDAADPANWAIRAAARIPIIHNIVIDDDTVPNTVPGSPLAGNEGLNFIMGLQSYSTSQMDPDGVRGVARFLPPAVHDSLFRPEMAPASTAEMQGQLASFVASVGTFVNVGNPELLVPVEPAMVQVPFRPVARPSSEPRANGLKRSRSVERPDVVRPNEQLR